MTSANGTALITGASSGQGEETLATVARSIAETTGRAVTTVQADLGVNRLATLTPFGLEN